MGIRHRRAVNAAVLVTATRDLLAIQASATIRILDPARFWELLRSGDDG